MRAALFALICGAAAASACGSSATSDDDDIALPMRQPESDAAAEAAAIPDLGADDASPPDSAASMLLATTNAKLCSADNLVLCFTFEGVAIDRSSNALPADTANVAFGLGHLGQAAVLGASSYIHFAAAPAFEVTTATIEAWVSTSAGGVVFDDDNRMSLTILADGTVQCVPDVALPTAKIPLGSWVHVACVFDGAATHVYVSGKEVDTGLSGPIGSSPLSTAALGGNAPSGEPFIGALGSVRVFSAARSAAEIAEAASP